MDSEQWTAGRDSGFGVRDSQRTKFIVQRSAFIVSLFLFTVHCALSTSFAATHVTGTYDLGANPRVMTTVGGTPEYGLVFAQRNKAVTYGGVEYGPSTVKGYLNASGQLNDGAGDLWLDLIPNLAATPADSYYVVTVNIQGRVHAEIWVVPDVASVAVEAVRQVQPPGATGSALDLASATGLLALAHGGTNQSTWTAARCVRVNNAGTQLESAAADCGTGGGSAPLASPTVSGTVKIDTTAADPVVYLKTSADTLLAGKASSVHTHSQNDVTQLTTDLAGKESLASKNQANGYAGLNGSAKLAASQVQEVLAAADLTDYAGTSGSGTTAIKATVMTPSDGQCLTWNNATSNWVNGACSEGSSNHNLLSATHPDTAAASPVRGDMIAAVGTTPTWQRVAHSATTGGYWKWNGTDVVASTGAASGTGACGANTWASTLTADAAPTCTQPSTSNLSDGANVVKNNQANTFGAFLQKFQAGANFQLTDPTDTTKLAQFDLSGITTGTTRTVTVPNANSTAVVPDTGAANNFLTAISATGVISKAQPTLANLAGGAAGANSYDFTGASVTRPLRRLAFASFPGTCTALTDFLARSDPATAGQAVYLCNSAGTGWDLVGDGGAGGGITTLNTLTAAVQTFATPGTTGTAPNWSSVTATHTLNIPMASAASVTAGLLSKTDYDVFNGKPNLVTSGTAGTGPSDVGTATTAARSDHDHRSIHQLAWYFPGTPATGVQNMTLTAPTGFANGIILNLQVTVNTTSASSSSFNIQRCTASCTGTTPTFGNIYATGMTLAANTRTADCVALGTCGTLTSTLAAGDQFKANLVAIGGALADVTVSMTVKWDTTN